MTPSVQALIEQANRKTANNRKRVFAKKADEHDHHRFLLKCNEVVIGIYHAAPALQTDNNFRAAMRELEDAMKLSRKKLQE